ncbi:MAG: hypothetical protein P1V35_06770 [Planctomycetota bacterium]|nr:hypothetical protein [Planctomycetota bacterium]
MIEHFNWRRACKHILAPVALFMVAACSTSSGEVASGADNGGVYFLNGGGAFEIYGPEGGPFPSGTRTYNLHNTSNEAAIWRLDASESWLTATPAAGLLRPGQQMPVSVEIDQAQAANPSPGSYPSELRLRSRHNSDGDGETYLAFSLNVMPVGGPMFRAQPSQGLVIHTNVNAAADELDGEITLENTGSEDLQWTATPQDGWVRLGLPRDTDISPGETDTLGIYIKESAMSALGAGTHHSQVELQNANDPSMSIVIPITVNLAPGSNNRIVDGLIAEYRFEEGSGTVVHDSSGLSPAMDLNIQDASAVSWQPSGLTISSPTLLSTPGAATRLSQSIRQSGELTVEAWIRPANLNQDGPARLVGISNGPSVRNFTLAQGLWAGQPKDTFNMRLRSTSTDLDGMPLITTQAGSASLGMQHLAFTRRASGETHIYVNGSLVEEGQTSGDTSNWDSSFRLAVANEIGAARPWQGEFFLLAMYDRALTGLEVQRNMAAGNGATNVGHLSVSPGSALRVHAVHGQGPTGPLDDLLVTNVGGEGIQWTATESAPWLSLGSTSGYLNSTQASTIQTHLASSTIAGMATGTYTATITFTNQTSSYGNTQRDVILTVTDPGVPGTGDKPGPHNTGPSNPGILQTVGGMTITQDGAVIENVRVYGAVNIEANNVTLRNFTIDAGGQPYCIRATAGKHGIVIEDGELINANSAHIYGGGFEARRLNLHESGGDGFKCTHDVLVEACWVHHIGTNPGAHADCNQTRAGSNFIFRGNNFDIPIDIGSPYKQNACWIIQTGDGPIDNVLLEDNWMNGGNFTVYFENKLPPAGSSRPNYGDPTNCRMINNRFGRNYRYGVLQATGYVYMSGNRWDDNGLLMGINNN